MGGGRGEESDMQAVCDTSHHHSTSILHIFTILSTGPETSGTVPNLVLQKLSSNRFRLGCGLSLIP